MNRVFIHCLLVLIVSFIIPNEMKSQKCGLCGYEYQENVCKTCLIHGNDTLYKKRELMQSNECFINTSVNSFKSEDSYKEAIEDVLLLESNNMAYITDRGVVSECDKLRKVVLKYWGKEKALEILGRCNLNISLAVANNGKIRTLEFWYKCPIENFITAEDILKLTKAITDEIKFVSPGRYELNETKLFTVSIYKKHVFELLGH